MSNENLTDVLVVEKVKLPNTEFPAELWTLNRPKALNALNSKLLSRLLEEGTRLKKELDADLKSCRVLIVKGSGEKAFAAGADITELDGLDKKSAESFSRLGQQAFGSLELLPIPTISAIQGFTLGGGLELAMCADILVATPESKFGQPEAHLGLLPGFGATARFVQRLGLSKALELLYSGRMIGAEEAHKLGLIQRLTNENGLTTPLLDFAFKIAIECVQKSGPLALKAIKEVARSASQASIQSVCDFEAKRFGELFESSEKREGVRAFLEKRKATF